MERRSDTWVAGLAAALLAVVLIAGLSWARSAQRPLAAGPVPSPASLTLPEPVPQPVTRTSAGAQVAWLWVHNPGQRSGLIAFDPAGRQVARSSEFTASGLGVSYGVWRSADGASVFTAGPDSLTRYSAEDPGRRQTYTRLPGEIAGDAFSPDGRLLALLAVSAGSPHLQMIDLGSGTAQTAAVGHDRGARLPGMMGDTANVVWGTPVFAADSAHLYTVTDWGGPLRVTGFAVRDGALVQTGAAVSGKDGRRYPTCPGPAMATRVVGGGTTLAAFCHGDGAVWFIDLRTLANLGTLPTIQANPFWLSPIFTPDGHLLYLHQPSAFGDSMQVVDLARRRLLGPVTTPTDVKQDGPFARLAQDAYAGGVATSVPLSPDGLKLYSAGNDGITVLRVPDLKPLARLAHGLRLGEVWISGDGRTLYAITNDGSQLVVMHEDGTGLETVSLPARAGGFLASEHG